MRILLMVVLLIIAVLLVIFGTQNNQPVDVRFLAYNTGNVSLSLVTILAAATGALLAALVSLLSSIRRGFSIRKTTRRVAELEQENTTLTKKVADLEQVSNKLLGNSTTPNAAAAPGTSTLRAGDTDPDTAARYGNTTR